MADRVAPFVPLKDEQLRASDPRELVWLSASAGTGKTHVLSARVLRLLLHGTAPDAILCLTFTKAGAAEMAERIHQRLASWVQLKHRPLAHELFALGERHDEAAVAYARTLFARVLDAPGGGLRIQTIHSFCQTLLAAFPGEAGLTPGFRPLDPREGAVLARRTLAELVAAAESGGRLGLIDDLQTLSRRLGEAAAETYLHRCARAPEAMAALGPGIAAKVRRALDVPAGDVTAMIVAACDEAGGGAGDGAPRFPFAALRQVSEANAAWGTATGLAAADRAVAFLAAGPEARAALIEEVAGLVVTATGSPRKPSPKLLAIAPDYPDHAARLAEGCAALGGLRRRAALADLLAAGLRAGQDYALAFEQAKRAAGVLDFDDLIRLAEQLLLTEGIGDWVRYKLDQATDHILVDEAQDTNMRQWTIVAALAAEFFAGDGARRDMRRTIFTVGDFKQAIYGFQGTDPAAFRAAGQLFAAKALGVERELLALSLDRSFRSTPPVLELVDRLLEELGPAALGLDEAANPHVSARAHLPGMVTLWRPVAAGADGADEDAEAEEGWIDDATRAFATRLARQVRAWLDHPFRIAGKGRDLRPEDILVLVRARGALASLIVARLHAEGVPVAGVDRLRLTAPLAVRDLLAAIRFALQPGDDLSLASLLVSPLFGLSQDELYRIGFGRKGTLWEAVRATDGFADVRAGLGGILAQADLVTPYQLLETILSGPLRGRARMLARLGPEARDPIEELVNAALAFEAADTPSLQRFLDWFDRGEVDITRDPSAPLDAVRVMTVHGAKGLQAPVVILADATGDPDAGRRTEVDWMLEPEGPGMPVIRPRKEELAGSLAADLERTERREREEHWRLLYVAATRAEERLVIGGALGPRAKGEPPARSWYRAIEDALSGLGAEWEPDGHWGEARHHRGGTAGGGRTASQRSGSERAGSERAIRARTPVPVPAEPGWLRRDPPREERPPRPLAPSAIGRDLTADPPPTPALRAAADRGRLLHALFERLPALPADGRMAAAARWLERSAGIDDAALRDALVADACRIIADPRFADLFGPGALAEAPVAAVVGGAVIAGTVDRLLVTDGHVRVIDFKTGRRVPAGLAGVPAHHLEQMAAYVAALEAVFPGKPVEAALLYTAGPLLVELPAAALAAHKPGLTGTQQILPFGDRAAG